jgi:hypothetical protein
MDVIAAVTALLQALDLDFFSYGFSALVSCQSRGGDNVMMSKCVHAVVSLW